MGGAGRRLGKERSLCTLLRCDPTSQALLPPYCPPSLVQLLPLASGPQVRHTWVVVAFCIGWSWGNLTFSFLALLRHWDLVSHYISSSEMT